MNLEDINTIEDKTMLKEQANSTEMRVEGAENVLVALRNSTEINAIKATPCCAL